MLQPICSDCFTCECLRACASVFTQMNSTPSMPLLISAGGNAGSQSATLIIRGLAVGDLTPRDYPRVLVREFGQGLVMGIILAAIGASISSSMGNDFASANFWCLSENAPEVLGLLAEIVRRDGLLSLERAVQQLTQVPARLHGLAGRGVLAPGAAADVCVIDPERLALGPVSMRRDLPGDAQRLYQEGAGYRAVFVNGVQTIADDTPTGEAPGTFLRVAD